MPSELCGCDKDLLELGCGITAVDPRPLLAANEARNEPQINKANSCCNSERVSIWICN